MTEFLAMILREIARRAALLVAGILLAIVLALALMHKPAPPKPTPMRVMDQPRCFPPGTILPPGGFLACPDSLPEMRSA